MSGVYSVDQCRLSRDQLIKKISWSGGWLTSWEAKLRPQPPHQRQFVLLTYWPRSPGPWGWPAWPRPTPQPRLRPWPWQRSRPRQWRRPRPTSFPPTPAPPSACQRGLPRAMGHQTKLWFEHIHTPQPTICLSTYPQPTICCLPAKPSLDGMYESHHCLMDFHKFYTVPDKSTVVQYELNLLEAVMPIYIALWLEVWLSTGRRILK